ncbi:MAG TPA: hypothetical protein DHW54_06855 [Gemmatimonadetes bacterium]|nr:hypothetical protein [Gemmatimonadota bacterium]
MMLPKLQRRERFSWDHPLRMVTGFVLAALISFSASAVEAQTGQIVGQVTDAGSSAPLSEVQVYLPDSEIGVLSRQDGRFIILNVPVGTYEVAAERIGYASGSQQVTVTAGASIQISFSLTSQALGLDEIVVTGTAGASRRREVGNSIAQINPSDIPSRPVSATDILQSSAPGITVSGIGGEIGQGKRIQLRGNTSVSMDNTPIIYIDGVRIMSGAFPQTAGRDYRAGRGANVTVSPLDAINPEDIDRIEILKGSAATTLYGTEASAGVIQVFTKRGATGAPVWTMEVQQGTGWTPVFGNPCRNVDPDMPAGVECADNPASNYMFMEPFLRDGWFGLGGGDWGSKQANGQPNEWYTGREGGAMWTQMYSASVRGGGEALQYFASALHDGQLGTMPNDQLDKWAFRGNFTFSPANDLQLQWNTGYTNQWQQNTPSGNNAQGISLNTFRRERNYFGSMAFEDIANVLGFDIQQRIERFTTGGTITYSPLANLTNRLTVGYDFSTQEARNLRPFGFRQRPKGALLNNMWQKRLLTFDYVSTYSLDISDALRTSLSWGGQAVGDEMRRLEGWGEDYPGAAEPTVSSASLKIAEENRQRVWTAGFFFQNVLDVSNKYFLTTGVRVDGNSAFGTGFGLQVYPKVSLSWVLSDEDFFPEDMGQIKLRTAYGQSGRAPGAFDAVRTWSPVGWGGVPAFVPANVGNPNLGPEVTRELELGLDGSFLDDRLSVAYTYFDQFTTDALMRVTQTPSSGFGGSQLENVGEIANSGHELAVDVGLLQTADFGWDVGASFTTNDSEVISLGGAPEFSSLGGRIMEGFPVPAETGIYVTNPTEIANPVYENDHYYGPQLPTKMLALNTTIRFPRGISLSAMGEYRGGHVIQRNPISISRSVRSPICRPFYANPDQSITLKDGVNALWRARCTPSQRGRGYWYDSSYFKLRNVSLQFPVDFAFPESVNNSTMTIALSNSYLWTKELPWMDPEMFGNQGANSTGLSSSERVVSPVTLRLSLRITF